MCKGKTKDKLDLQKLKEKGNNLKLEVFFQKLGQKRKKMEQINNR